MKIISFIRKINWEKWGAPLALFTLLLIASWVGWPYFLKPQNIANILRQASYTGIIALGMTFVIIAGGIDLSVGSMSVFVASCGIIVLNFLLGSGISDYQAVIYSFFLMLLVGSFAGAINGVLVAWGKIVPFIVTLGTMSIFRYLSLYMANAGEFSSKSNFLAKLGGASLYSFKLSSYTIPISLPVVVLLILTLFYSFILNNTRFGRYVYAIGSNARVAEYSAIRVSWVRFWVFVIAGISVGISAFLLTARFSTVSTPNFGLGFELDAIAAVVIGGTSMSGGRGIIWGTLIGCIILQVIQNMLNMAGLSPYLQGVVKGIIIIASVYIQRQKN